jgi:CheY-like chemotaxis protein
MSLESLVYCSDNKDTRVLRRVLSDLGIEVEHCGDADSAIYGLTRRRYEAVIVDCEDRHGAAEVLRTARHAPGNQHAIGIALLEEGRPPEAADLLVPKPLSFDRALTSLRGARAVMKRERLRNARVAVEVPITFVTERGECIAVTSDIGEGGLSLAIPHKARTSAEMNIRFTLPGTDSTVECRAATAWDDPSGQSGIRFVDLPAQDQTALRSWVSRHASGFEPEDPPQKGDLTDLTPYRCRLVLGSGLPKRTALSLTMKSGGEVKIDAVVHDSDPEKGMEVEFRRDTDTRRASVEQLLKLAGKTGRCPVEVEVMGLEPATS